MRAGLAQMGYPAEDLRSDQVMQYCWQTLRLLNVRTREAFDAFRRDTWTLDNLATAYAEDLGRPASKRPNAPLVDPVGLCVWGARIHLAPEAYRADALRDVKASLREMRAQGAE
jgi:hypothetical protein